MRACVLGDSFPAEPLNLPERGVASLDGKCHGGTVVDAFGLDELIHDHKRSTRAPTESGRGSLLGGQGGGTRMLPGPYLDPWHRE